MADYWFDLGIGIGSGMLLGVISRITSAMCGGGMLIHESYMTFWASLTTLVLAPIFFGAYIYNSGEKVKTELSMEQTANLLEVLAALFCLCLFKYVYLERDMMKRFVEDFDSEVHAIDTGVDEIHQSHEIEPA